LICQGVCHLAVVDDLVTFAGENVGRMPIPSRSVDAHVRSDTQVCRLALVMRSRREDTEAGDHAAQRAITHSRFTSG